MLALPCMYEYVLYTIATITKVKLWHIGTGIYIAPIYMNFTLRSLHVNYHTLHLAIELQVTVL